MNWRISIHGAIDSALASLVALALDWILINQWKRTHHAPHQSISSYRLQVQSTGSLIRFCHRSSFIDNKRHRSAYISSASPSMAFTFVAFAYILALIITALLIFFAIWHVSSFECCLSTARKVSFLLPTPRSLHSMNWRTITRIPSNNANRWIHWSFQNMPSTYSSIFCFCSVENGSHYSSTCRWSLTISTSFAHVQSWVASASTIPRPLWTLKFWTWRNVKDGSSSASTCSRSSTISIAWLPNSFVNRTMNHIRCRWWRQMNIHLCPLLSFVYHRSSFFLSYKDVHRKYKTYLS